MASARITRACGQAQQALVERCFAGASKKVKEAALVAVQQLPVHEVARLDSYSADAADLLKSLVLRVEDRELCKMLVKHNKELAGTELVYAAECGKEERVRQLLAEGASVNARDKDGRAPLSALALSSGLRFLPDLQLRLARLLLEAGALVDAVSASGATALWESVALGRFALAHLLLGAGATTNIGPNQTQVSLLQLLVGVVCQRVQHCIFGGNDGYDVGGLARKLVAAGVPMDTVPPDDLSPLAVAVDSAVRGGLHNKQLLELVETLLELGADPRAQGASGFEVLVRVAAVLSGYNHYRPLHAANFRRLLQRLVAAGAHVNIQCRGVTLLALMCQACGNPAVGPPEPILRALIEAGGDLLAEQPMPLPHFILLAPPEANTPSTLRALAALGYPMDLEFEGSTALECWLRIMMNAIGDWPGREQPSPFQLACLEALVDSGCPLGGSLKDAGSWLAAGVRTGSMAVVQALLRACPAGFSHISQTLHGATALEQATEDLCRDLAMIPVDLLEQTLEGLLGERVLWYCTVAPVLLAAGSPPAADYYLNSMSMLPLNCQEQLRFLPIVASGSSWSPETHHMYPPAFCTAARQLLLVHECCGFGGSEPSSGQARGASRKRRAGSRRSRRPARTMGIQLPQDVLHHILGLASQPLLDWVPSLAALQ